MGLAEQVLLRQTGRATSADSKTVRAIRFEVPPGVETLSLRYDYGPRTTEAPEVLRPLVEAAFALHTRRWRETLGEPAIARHREALNIEGRARLLHNLMNVVLVDPAGQWRGRWDRNPTSDAGALVLGREHASRGFLPGAIQPGTWTVAIETHGIFGDVEVTYEVEVRGRPPLGAEEIARLALPAPPPAPHARPRRRGRGWYFGELHSHTVHSDGKWELGELCARVAASGADFLALTDHNTTSGTADPPPGLALTLLPGCELTTFHGHHPVYGITQIIPWHEDGRVLPLAETGARVRALGGIVGVAHPFVPGDPLCTGCRMIEGLDPRHFDLMEVWYRRWDSPGSDNEAAYELWNRHWRNGHRVVGVAARDLHGPEQEGPFPGPLPFTGILAEDGTAEAILAGLRRGAVIMSGGPIVELAIVGDDGTRAGIGETIHLSMTPRAAAVSIDRLDGGPAELRLYRSGERVLAMRVDGDGTIDVGAQVDRPGWYRAELWQDGLPRCLTNHVTVV